MDIPNQSHASEDLTTTINNRLFRINNKKARQKKLSEDCDKSIDIRTEFKLLHVRETTWTVKWRIGQRTSEGSLTKKRSSHTAPPRGCALVSPNIRRERRDETRPEEWTSHKVSIISERTSENQGSISFCWSPAIIWEVTLGTVVLWLWTCWIFSRVGGELSLLCVRGGGEQNEPNTTRSNPLSAFKYQLLKHQLWVMLEWEERNKTRTWD